MRTLEGKSWAETITEIRKCHLSLLSAQKADTAMWKSAFDHLVNSVKEERRSYPEFAGEVVNLTEDTGSDYDFEDILEEYFDFMEENGQWETVLASSEEMLSLFAWKEQKPSEYMFRKGNALQRLGRFEEAEKFGRQWLMSYPEDYYAAASNVFLLVSLNRLEEAEALTRHYLRDELICDNLTDTLFMAAYRLYEKTENVYAKERVAKKMAEYGILADKIRQK